MSSTLSRSEVLPTTVRAVIGASLRLLVRADEAAVRAAETGERLRAVLPRPRLPYDEL